MKIPKLQFPHISRLFSAPVVVSLFYWTERTMLWSLLAGLLYLNVSSVMHAKNEDTAYFLPVLKNPYSARVHMQIATTLWEKGLQVRAKKELALAEEFAGTGDTSVLGVSTTPGSILTFWNAQPKKIENEYIFWRTITEGKPDYRDAFIQAGTRAYELGKTGEAIDLLQKSYDLDPNFQIGKELLATVKH